MKHSFIYKGLLSVLSMAFAACGPSVIPDAELRDIFEEVYLTNAYFQSVNSVPTDSLDLYAPILEKRGYDLRDLRHTIGNFSKRKSGKISNVVEAAQNAIRGQAQVYDRRVAMLDTVDARARRMFSHEVLFERRIEVRAVADTARLRFVLPVGEGTYKISYTYLLDSLDRNSYLRNSIRLLDSTGRQLNNYNAPVTLGKRTTYSRDVEAGPRDRTMEISLGGYSDKMTRPRLTVDSLRVVYRPERRIALDSLDARVMEPYLPIILRYESERTLAQDSGALHPHPTWPAPARGDNPR